MCDMCDDERDAIASGELDIEEIKLDEGWWGRFSSHESKRADKALIARDMAIDRILAAERERDAAKAEAAELQQLFDKQHTRTVKADQLWREAHPGNDLVCPDLGSLIDWLLGRADAAESRAARLAEALDKIKTELKGWMFVDDEIARETIASVATIIENLENL